MERELSSFLDDNRGCIVIRKDTEKQILKVPATVSGGPTLFVKIYTFSHFGTRLRNFLGSRKSGIKDLRTCKKLKGLGVPVPAPVGACADSFLAGFARRSLFAAKWMVDAVSVRDLILDQVSRQWPREAVIPIKREDNLGDEIRNDICVFGRDQFFKFNFDLGAFIAGIHKCGIYTNDMNPGNILVQLPINSELGFLLVDYEGIFFKKKVPKKKCIANLTQIAAFMSHTDEDASRVLCGGYAEENRRFNREEITEIVEIRAKELQKIWKKKLNDKFNKISRKLQQSKIK
ncbi:MAG: hypothetical protein ACYS0I_05710 [Planctomycetota bacterium]|jgi:hypothetical protein